MKIRFAMKKKYVYITFQCRRHGIKFICFDLLIYHLCFYEILACVDVSFRMISFPCSVYITFYHLKRNFISVKVTTMKYTQISCFNILVKSFKQEINSIPVTFGSMIKDSKNKRNFFMIKDFI